MNGISASLSGMANALARLGLTAQNIANQQTPGYQALRAENAELASGGVTIGAISRDPRPGVPFPDAAGLPTIEGSNVDPTLEQVNLVLNRRQFEANLSALKLQNDTLGEILDLRE
jgi:flagellar basal body rod protein FlgG